jgi:hypothetical protein
MAVLLQLAVFASMFALGVWGIVDPHFFSRIRRRPKLPENLWTGGVFYSTPKRARTTAFLFTLLMLFGIVSAIREFVRN